MPPSVGRIALRSISGRMAAFGRRRGRLRREVRLGSTSQEVMPGGASGDARPASRGRKTSQSGSAWPVFASQRQVSPSARPVPAAPGKQNPLRKIVVERFATLTREEREPVTGEMRRKAGEDHARSQCPEKHLGTQGCLRQEVMRRKIAGGGDARWREEVMLALSRQEAEEHKKMNTTRILEARISR